MDNTSNIYGIKDITLTADSQVIFHSNLDRFAFDESRYLNSFTDFEEWKEHRSFYIKVLSTRETGFVSSKALTAGS